MSWKYGLFFPQVAVTKNNIKFIFLDSVKRLELLFYMLENTTNIIWSGAIDILTQFHPSQLLSFKYSHIRKLFPSAANYALYTTCFKSYRDPSTSVFLAMFVRPATTSSGSLLTVSVWTCPPRSAFCTTTECASLAATTACAQRVSSTGRRTDTKKNSSRTWTRCLKWARQAEDAAAAPKGQKNKLKKAWRRANTVMKKSLYARRKWELEEQWTDSWVQVSYKW